MMQSVVVVGDTNAYCDAATSAARLAELETMLDGAAGGLSREEDCIDHPNYYILPNGIECEKVISHFKCPEAMVMKYVWRAGKKPQESKLKDLQKAAHWLQVAIAMAEQERG